MYTLEQVGCVVVAAKERGTFLYFICAKTSGMPRPQKQASSNQLYPFQFRQYVKVILVKGNGQAPIGRLKSAPLEDFFYVAMLRCVSCFPSCQEGVFNVE